MPDEIHSLAQGVAVMNPVVAEPPDFGGMKRRQHRDPRDSAIQPFRVEQRVVGGVVPEHKQAGHRDRGHDPQRHEQERIVGQNEPGHRGPVERDITKEDRESPGGRTFITMFGNDLEYWFQSGGRLRTLRKRRAHRFRCRHRRHGSPHRGRD